MKAITKYLEDFLNNIQEDMVLYIINGDTFSIEPVSAEEYNLEDLEDAEKITINGYNIYIFEGL